MMSDAETFDLVGIGCGPSNLSLAALAYPVHDLKSVFLDRRLEFSWHPGLLLEDSKLQVSYLKDLVTLVDPTSEFSFLNFLATEGRLYRFINAGTDNVSRLEFEQYYRWVTRKLSTVRLANEVKMVTFDDGMFVVNTTQNLLRARHLAVGTGQVAYVPDFAAFSLGDTVLHASEFMLRNISTHDTRILIVGGGQTGAEIVHHLLTRPVSLPRELTWVSSRENFLPRDDSAFVNEWFSPAYCSYFHGLTRDHRAARLKHQKLASDGISESLLQLIYRELYRNDYLASEPLNYCLLPGHYLTGLRPHETDTGWLATLIDGDTGHQRVVEADIVLLATGFRQQLPECLDPLKNRLHVQGEGLVVREDYSLEWDGPDDRRIFVLNGSGHHHGIADANLSLVAWRAAVILNAVARRSVYTTDRDDSTLWPVMSC